MRTLVSNGNSHTKVKLFHCAIYTRKSTEEGLGQEFTSLDSQREYCEAFVKSRELEGWRPYIERYDDGGFTGGNTNRPALKKLLADARQGKFQIVVCYKYDRLSRNTRDFLAILDVFDRSGVAFVSVTQPIDTTSSVGRLMRSILMDFSQFEREMISERTRDKLHAMAKRGKRTGGYPIIGYDIDPEKKSLKVNPEEKPQAIEMFDTYNRTKSLSATAEELNQKGYRMKAWVTRKGLSRGGQKFTKASLWYLLQNPLYIGKITHRKEIYPGEHEAIVPLELFEAARKVLRANGDGKLHRHIVDRKHVFLLRGLVRCACCQTAMTPFSALSKKNSEGHRRFFYYKCLSVVKGTRDACQTRYIGAPALESYVIRRLGELAGSEVLVDRIVKESQQVSSVTLPLKLEEKKRLSAEKGKVQIEIESLVGVLAKEGGANHKNYQMIMDMLSDLKDRRENLELKISALNLEIEKLETQQIDTNVLQRNLQNFLQVFNKLDGDQRAELVAFMVKQVIWDKANMWVTIELRAAHPLFGDLNLLTGRFDYRQTSLPDSNVNQNSGLEQSGDSFDYRQTSLRESNGLRKHSTQINPLFEVETVIGDLFMWDDSVFGWANGAKGVRLMLAPAAAQAIRSQQRRWQNPKPPPIQTMLKQACQLKIRLEQDPGLTRAALANEVGMNPSYLTRILNLLNLGPEIQSYILSLPPSQTKGPITESRIKHLARISSHEAQHHEFNRLKNVATRRSAVTL